MRFRLSCLAVTLAAAAMAGPASGQECAPAWIDGDPGALPEAWRRALFSLVAATAHEGQPWSCTGARVSLQAPGDGRLAKLEVEDASGVRRRPVAAPADVISLGKAMLAKVVVAEPPPVSVGRTSAPWASAGSASAPWILPVLAPTPLTFSAELSPPPPPSIAEAAPVSPRPEEPAPDAVTPARRSPSSAHAVVVDALAGARYTGPTRALMMGAELRASMIFGRWLAGLSARYDAAVSVFQPVPDRFSLASVSVGLPVGYRILRAQETRVALGPSGRHAPIELTAEVEPSLAVILMGADKPGQEEPDVDSHVDMRLGARLAMAIPVSERLRLICALGAEGAPAALFDDRHSRRKALPELPGYLAGLSLGMEASVLE